MFTLIFVLRGMIFNQENHVHTTAVVGKKTDAGTDGGCILDETAGTNTCFS
jgi:hypothetical protein